MTTERVAAQSVTFVRASKPGSDEYFATAQERMRVQDGEAETFVRYRVEPPPNMLVSKAELDFTAEKDFVGGAAARAVAADSGPFRDMTWNTRPANVAGSADRPATVNGQNLRMPVTDDVVAAVAADVKRVAFRISATSAERQWLVGPDGGKGWPRLILTFETAPRVPTDLSPAGVVSKAKSWHQWLGHPDAYQVQLQFAAVGATWDAATGFAAPVHDTGAIARDGDAVNMAEVSPDWVGLADGESLDWSVRQRLPGGWGKWAPPETYSRVVKLPGQIVSPGETTADSSPPIVWVPPETQTAWQVIVDIVGSIVGGLSLIPDRQANSGMRPGATTDSWVPDMGGDDPGTIYRIRLRTWDDEDRVPLPGDPPFAETEWVTTFTPTKNVAGLSTLQLTQVPGLPAVEAAWSRWSGVPDEVALRGGGSPVRLPGTDSGTWVWTFTPNRDLEVEGRAVVNGEQSDTARVRGLHMVVPDVWLVDPETGRGCVLSGTEGLSVGYGDVTVVHTPIDGAVLLRRTLVTRGLEGSITGQIDEWPGRSHQQQVDDVMWLRERSRRPLQLIMGDLSVSVVCTSLQALFDPEWFFHDSPAHIVSFAFSHAGDSR